MPERTRHEGMYRDAPDVAELEQGTKLLEQAEKHAAAQLADILLAHRQRRNLPDVPIFDGSGYPADIVQEVIDLISNFVSREISTDVFDFIEKIETKDNIVYLHFWRENQQRRDQPPILDKSLQSATPDELLEEYCKKKGIPADQRLEMKEAMSKLAERPVSGTWQDRENARRTRPTADVELPDSPPELWQGSLEKAQAEAGELKLDDAIIAFTKRAYYGFLPGQQPVGLAISDFRAGDRLLYEEWVGLKNRLSSRTKNTEWPEGSPFPSRNIRNDFVLEGLKEGTLAPPRNQKTYASMKSSFMKRHDINLDAFLDEKRAIIR